MRRLRLLALPVITVGLAACTLGAAAPAVTETPDTDSADRETYVDAEAGFAIDYPAGWRVESQPGQLLQIFSPGPIDAAPRQQDSFPADATKIEVIPQHPGDSRSIDQIIADMRAIEDGPGGRIVSDEIVTLSGGEQAHRLTMTGGMIGEVLQPVLLVEINGRILQVAGYGDTARFDEIAGTLRASS